MEFRSARHGIIEPWANISVSRQFTRSRMATAIHILAKAMWCIRFLMHTKVVLSNFGDTKNIICQIP